MEVKGYKNNGYKGGGYEGYGYLRNGVTSWCNGHAQNIIL